MRQILAQVIKAYVGFILAEVDSLSYSGQAPPLTSEEVESVLKENNIARFAPTIKTEQYMLLLSVTNT